jgi:hypothetical protein
MGVTLEEYSKALFPVGFSFQPRGQMQAWLPEDHWRNKDTWATMETGSGEAVRKGHIPCMSVTVSICF